MSDKEAQRRRRQSACDRAAEQQRREAGLHDEAVLQPDPDRPVWGARAIALAAGLVDKHGKPRVRAAYHLLAVGLLPADRIGKSYISTPRRLRAIANGEASEPVTA